MAIQREVLMQVDEMEFYNRLLDYHNILFLCHRNADPDAVSSAFALSEAFGGTVGLVEGCNRLATLLVDRLGIEVVDEPDPENYEFIVVVDTSTTSQLNDIELSNYCVIDHHSTTALTEKADFYLHSRATSTAEIVYKVLKSMGAPITRRTAIGLISGIITDTGHFKHANSCTFRNLADIIESSGVEYAEVLDMMATAPQDISLRIAMLKSAQRLEIERVDEWLVVTTHVSSFGGAASSMLINIGADIALVATTCDGSIRVSARAKRDAVNAGVNLGKIMEDISEHYRGTGGGHPGAAGIDVVTDVNRILSECKKHVLETLKKETVKNENR